MKNIVFIVITLVMIGCTKQVNKDTLNNPDLIHQTVHQLTEVMVHDIFSPPVSSRVYAYTSIAAYEAFIPSDSTYKSLAGQLTGLTETPKPIPTKEYNFEVASLQACIEVGKSLVFSTEKLDAYEEEITKKIKEANLPNDVLDRSKKYGLEVAHHILAWADKDNYKESRTFPEYKISKKMGDWKPTPPDYMKGIEPHWNKLRPFVLDSAKQFSPPPPTPFSIEKKSQFLDEVMLVYKTGNRLSEEQKNIAQFWDCNPFESHTQGHLMFGTKKITPGGHWIGITGIVTKQAGFDYAKTLEAYAKVAIGLADAFISCWDEKWKTNVIRPETVINEHIDENWMPLLQTPPFPEYTSGHSVASASAATILTEVVGDNVRFEDTVEIEYGLPMRTFTSFNQAASEAAISRLYGGIHYMPAIKNGVEQGKRVGAHLLKRLHTHK